MLLWEWSMTRRSSPKRHRNRSGTCHSDSLQATQRAWKRGFYMVWPWAKLKLYFSLWSVLITLSLLLTSQLISLIPIPPSGWLIFFCTTMTSLLLWERHRQKVIPSQISFWIKNWLILTFVLLGIGQTLHNIYENHWKNIDLIFIIPLLLMGFFHLFFDLFCYFKHLFISYFEYEEKIDNIVDGVQSKTTSTWYEKLYLLMLQFLKLIPRQY